MNYPRLAPARRPPRPPTNRRFLPTLGPLGPFVFFGGAVMDEVLELTADESTALVVFGMDDSGKPHASQFGEADAPLAEKAAGLMGMHVFRPTTDEHRALAAKLPRGRVFGSGKAFVPFVKAGTYEALAGAAGVSATQAARKPKSAPTGLLGQREAIPTGTPAATFAEIGVGSLVLAKDAADAWFKAVVLKATGDRLTLMWPDYPDYGKFSRRAWQLGLLPPARKSA